MPHDKFNGLYAHAIGKLNGIGIDPTIADGFLSFRLPVETNQRDLVLLVGIDQGGMYGTPCAKDPQPVMN